MTPAPMLAQELNTHVWDAYSGVIPNTHVPVWLKLKEYHLGLEVQIIYVL